MEANTPAASGERFQVKVTADSHFAWFRTRLSLERTMMSWVRTATALIGFGFTIVQFFERFNSMEGVAPAMRPAAARYVGLVMIASGVLALLISLVQYRAAIRYLWHGDFSQIAGVGAGQMPGHTPVYAIAIGLVLVGMFAFLVVLVRAI
jgi:putative membrane protein